MPELEGNEPVDPTHHTIWAVKMYPNFWGIGPTIS